MSQKRSPIKRVPNILIYLTQWVIEHGLVEGIFRKSGSAREIDQLKAKLDDGTIPPIDPKTNPNTIAALIKLFFRLLPVPLIPEDQYQLLMQLDCTSISISRIKCIIAAIPDAHFYCLKFICSFLLKFSQHSPITKMDVYNLGTVFATNIIRPSGNSGSLDDSLRVTDRVMIFNFMITNSHEIFEDKSLRKPDWYRELKTVAKQSSALSVEQSQSNKSTLEISKKESAMDILNFIHNNQKPDKLEIEGEEITLLIPTDPLPSFSKQED
uniref:Rho-GAP domain-containing protein n=1 Tax=Arcella intermedia TaxID=1963864 RepID=A0A6B2LD67_9EUKA